MLGRRTVCGRSGEEECVEVVCENVWEKSRMWEKRPSRASARSKILLMGCRESDSYCFIGVRFGGAEGEGGFGMQGYAVKKI